MNSAAINICVQVLPEHLFSVFLGYFPRSGMVGSQDNSIFNLLRTCHAVFPSPWLMAHTQMFSHYPSPAGVLGQGPHQVHLCERPWGLIWRPVCAFGTKFTDGEMPRGQLSRVSGSRVPKFGLPTMGPRDSKVKFCPGYKVSIVSLAQEGECRTGRFVEWVPWEADRAVSS